MITGVHNIIYSTNPESDRAFFRDTLQLPNVDAGGGWLIFGMPPSELAFHPGGPEHKQELYLMCADIEIFIGKMKEAGIACSAINEERWGRLVQITLPGGGSIGVYQPKHERP